MGMIGVVYFPGTNCEVETLQAVKDEGMQGRIIRWNQPELLSTCDALIIPGGWSFEDRVRAGAIAARTPIMQHIKKLDIPILGICNGAQVLVEAGMVGDVALAPNKNEFISGYFCEWVYIRVDAVSSPWLGKAEQGMVMTLPVAHGEGRFVSAERAYFDSLKPEQKPLVYCDAEGKSNGFPINPNGSVDSIAALASGKVLAMMPHPERAAYEFQMCGRGEPVAKVMFESIKNWLDGQQ